MAVRRRIKGEQGSQDTFAAAASQFLHVWMPGAFDRIDEWSTEARSQLLEYTDSAIDGVLLPRGQRGEPFAEFVGVLDAPHLIHI